MLFLYKDPIPVYSPYLAGLVKKISLIETFARETLKNQRFPDKNLLNKKAKRRQADLVRFLY